MARSIFTQPQMTSIATLLMSAEKGPRVVEWLNKNYNIRMENFIHDEFTVTIPPGLTEEDGAVIFAEMMATFRG